MPPTRKAAVSVALLVGGIESSSAFCVHEVEHQGLFVIKKASLSIFDDLITEIEQGRDNLQTGLIETILLPQ